MRFKVKLFVALALALSAGLVYAGIKNQHVNQFPAPADFAKHVLPLHFDGWAVTGNRVKCHYHTVRDNMVVTGVHAIVRTMAGTISAFTVNLSRNDLSVLGSAIDMYSTGLATAGTIYDGTLINVPTVYRTGDEMGVDFVFTGTDTPTATDIDVYLDYHTFVGLEN